MAVLHSQTIAESLHWDPKTFSSTASEPADTTFTVTASKEWRPLSLNVSYASSTQAGNRQVELQLRSTANDILYQITAPVVQAASVTRLYNFALGGHQDAAFVDTDKMSITLPDITLPANYDIRVFDNKTIGTTVAPDNLTARIHLMERNNPSTA